MRNTAEKIKTISFAELTLSVSLLLVGTFHEYLSCIVSVIMLIWLIGRGAKGKPLNIYLNITSAAVISIVFFYGVTAFWAVDSGMALIGFIKFLPIFLYLLVLFQTEDAEKVRLTLPYSAAFMTVVSAIGMQIPALENYFSVAGRLAGFFQYSNTFALFALVAELLLISRERLKWFDIAVTAILVFGILYSGSRTVFMLAVASNAVMIFAMKRSRAKWAVIAVIAGLAAVAAAYILLSEKTAIFERLFNISLNESTFVGRLLYFRDAFPVILRHPFGLGYMGYYYIQQSIQSGVYSVMFVHNDFLQLMLDVGWIPALLLAAAVIKSVFGKNKPLYVRVILSVMFLHGCFDFDLQFAAVFMLLLLFCDYKTGKHLVIGDGSLVAGISVMMSIVCLYFGIALGLAHFGDCAAAYSLYPWDTRNETQLLIKKSSDGDAEELADDILDRNEYVTVAYSAKAHIAYSNGDFEQLMEIKNQIFRNAPFAYEEYKEYSYMLITRIRLYRQAGDQTSAEICLRELENTAEAVHTADKHLSSLGKKIKDQPTVRLPDDVEDYIKSEEDRQ